ncbi:metallophosphoesterase [Paenibacillus sp. D2_2]|uniref:fibronectin type III domain-containing protein n=1 Tax=Paenibacillus sp. D2_2 TaxID=3073092 RepID=UPI0028162446|nr:fibronectin type III domain-containing protein [Paenibacillus sp. D2_2]WMT40921.1 metallophosphoesterase [Paenibacillus sp. D2_2]
MLIAIFMIVTAAFPGVQVQAEADMVQTGSSTFVDLIPASSTWSYNDEGLDYSGAMTSAFDFSTWPVGLSPLGYKVKSGVTSGDVAPDKEFGKVNTIISFGGDASNKHITSYFSKIISIPDVNAYASFQGTFGVDDGLILYANGQEIYRTGMPVGQVGYGKLATSNKDLPVVTYADLTDTLKGALKDGDNLFTAEVHNQSASSSDLYFDMKLTAQLRQNGSGSGDENNGSGGPGGNGSDNGAGNGSNDNGESGNAETSNIKLMAPNSTWRYLDNGSDQGAAWRAENFNDSAWSAGPAPLGYPVSKATAVFGGIKQVISYGPSSSKKYITSYFRTTMNVKGLADYKKIVGTFGIDDGVILYANGQEVYRYNMPDGEAGYQTLSATTIDEPVTETADLTQALKGVLREGVNTLAAEVHQRSESSSDLYFDMQLIANPTDTGTGGGSTSGPETPTAIALTFNGDVQTSQGFAWYTIPTVTGTKVEVIEASRAAGSNWPSEGVMTFEGNSMPIDVYQSSSDKSAGKKTSYTDHKVTATGLKPGTEYSYRVGDGEAGRWSDIGTFKTADQNPESFTFLYTTDPQGTTEREYVTWKHTLDEALKKFPDSRFITITGDLVDNGDIENQWMWLLNQPNSILKDTPLVPALGNHESKANNNFWYHFNLPNISYTGAKPDGSVYSFDYGPAHFMVINTEYNEAKDIDTVYQKQEEWLRAEAAKTDKKWKIVLFHKSPYSVANHSSDSDVLFFRDKLVALFDEIGVDVVLSGHDHTYTRTYPMYNNVPEKVAVDANGNMDNPNGTLYLVSNAAGDKRYTPKSGPFPYAFKYGQPGKEMFTGITITNDSISFKAYTTTETGTTDVYDQFNLTKSDAKPGPVQGAMMSPIQNGQAVLSWSKSESGSVASAYRIYEKNGQLDPNWNARIVPDANASSFSYTVTGLDPHNSYQFAIKAVNGKSSSAETIAVTNNGNGGDNGGDNGGNTGGNNGGNGGDNGGNTGGDNGGNGGDNGGNTGGNNGGNGGNNGGNTGGSNGGNAGTNTGNSSNSANNSNNNNSNSGSPNGGAPITEIPITVVREQHRLHLDCDRCCWPLGEKLN